jgi:hypothetical protein
MVKDGYDFYENTVLNGVFKRLVSLTAKPEDPINFKSPVLNEATVCICIYIYLNIFLNMCIHIYVWLYMLYVYICIYDCKARRPYQFQKFGIE